MSRGTKLSLGEFMGDSRGKQDSLPKGPAQRGPDDDGSFQRHRGGGSRYNDYNDRGGGGYNDRGRSDDRGGGGWRGAGNREDDRGGGGGGGWRGGGRNEDDRGGGGGWRGAGRNEDDRASGGGGGGWRGAASRDGDAFRGGPSRDEDSGGNAWNRGSEAVGETRARPKLQLKTRTIATAPAKSQAEPVASPTRVTPPPTTEKKVPYLKEEVVNEKQPSPPPAEKASSEQADEKPKREPESVNSRAAAFGLSPSGGREDSAARRFRSEDRGPPPVRNARFERMAEEEREKNRARQNERGPPPMANSRFAAAAEADRSYDRNDQGPPPVANSRFAAAAEADRSSSYDRNDQGPPPVANSRFAAAAEADRERGSDMDRSFGARDNMGPPPVANSRFAAAAEADRSYGRDDRGPPPVANSRFAAAAEADRSYDRPSSSYGRDDRGPPPVANSRFAAAAEAHRTEESYSRDSRGPERSFDNRGPPPVANSRFAAAAARAEEENRERDDQRRDRFDDRGGRFGGNRYDGGRRFEDSGGYRNRFQEPEPEQPTRVDELLKPKKPSEETVLDPKSQEHEANMFKFPAKALKKEDDEFLGSNGRTEEAAAEEEPVAQEEEPIVSISSVSAGTSEEILNKFVSGDKLGEDLKAWCEEIRPTLPTVEKLVLHLLKEKEKLNPDPDCGWADPSQYGSALLSLVEDDLFNQMQVLWAIQFYCDGLGFPKFNNESVVQSMFRSMYKFDLAEAEAFEAWKEDDSEVHDQGKMKTIIQTVDWFNWLEEDDDDDEEEEYDE